MLLNLATAREKLWPHCAQGVPYSMATADMLADATFRLNQVSERILGDGKYKNTLRRVTIDIHDGYITLPRELGTILGIKLLTSEGRCCNSIIYSRFHEFAHCICCSSTGTYPLTETAQTFIVPDAPFTFRVKSTVTAGTISFIGGWDENDDELFTTETLNITNGSVDGAQTYNVMPPAGGIQKTQTTVPVELYSVDSNGNEMLIAVYGPNEEVPSYKRYKVPNWSQQFTSALVRGKLAFVPAVADSDIIIPSNFGALKLGLKALQSEDTEEDESAQKDWERVFTILDKEVTETDADSEFPMFRTEGEFGCAGIHNVI